MVLVTESDAEPILCKLQCKLSKQLLSPSKPPDAWKAHYKSTVCNAQHGSEGGSDSQRAPGSSRQQQHRVDRRQQQQQQQHELQTPGDAIARSAAQLAGDAGTTLKKKLG